MAEEALVPTLEDAKEQLPGVYNACEAGNIKALQDELDEAGFIGMDSDKRPLLPIIMETAPYSTAVKYEVGGLLGMYFNPARGPCGDRAIELQAIRMSLYDGGLLHAVLTPMLWGGEAKVPLSISEVINLQALVVDIAFSADKALILDNIPELRTLFDVIGAHPNKPSEEDTEDAQDLWLDPESDRWSSVLKTWPSEEQAYAKDVHRRFRTLVKYNEAHKFAQPMQALSGLPLDHFQTLAVCCEYLTGIEASTWSSAVSTEHARLRYEPQRKFRVFE